MKELRTIVRALLGNPSAAPVLATLVKVEGSSYRRPGARLLVMPDGRRIGSISGGCLEEDILARAEKVARTGEAQAVVYDTTSENDLVWGVGLGCHGVVRVLIERLGPHAAWPIRLQQGFVARRATTLVVTHEGAPGELGTALAPESGQPARGGVFVQEIRPLTALHIFGAGNDAQPLARLAAELGWIVVVADPRPAFATKERFPEADVVMAGPIADLTSTLPLDRSAVAVVMTHHYVHDVPLLRALFDKDLAYLGLLGPQKRAERILADIAASGKPITAEQRARLHAPVGLDLGADGPEQVALAIVAEIQAVLAGRNARPLRGRSDPIHGGIESGW